MLKYALTSIIALAPIACTSTPPSHETIQISAEECAATSYCFLQGELSITFVGHVQMGQLRLANGDCVNISLPQDDVQRALDHPDKQVFAQGSRFNAIPGPDVVQLWNNGRRVDMGGCSDFYVFVE